MKILRSWAILRVRSCRLAQNERTQPQFHRKSDSWHIVASAGAMPPVGAPAPANVPISEHMVSRITTTHR